MDVSVNVGIARPFCGPEAFAQIQLACVSLCQLWEPFLCHVVRAFHVDVYRVFRVYRAFRVSRVFRVSRAYHAHDYAFALFVSHRSSCEASLSVFLSVFPCLLLFWF